MSAEMFFFSSLRFESRATRRQVLEVLRAEGYLEDADNLLVDELNAWEGLALSLSVSLSGPESGFLVTAGALGVLAEHAAHGESLAVHLEAEWGYRCR